MVTWSPVPRNVTRTEPLYEPAARAVLTETFGHEGVVPEAWDTLSHPPSEAAMVNACSMPEVLNTATYWEGLGSSEKAVKLSDGGETETDEAVPGPETLN
jgi:hypothetical protein